MKIRIVLAMKQATKIKTSQQIQTAILAKSLQGISLTKIHGTSMFKSYKLSEKHDVTKTTTDGYVASNNKRDTNVDHLHATVELTFKELCLDDSKREKARHCTNTISRNVANMHKLIELFKMRIANAFGKRSSLSTFVAFKERQSRENHGDFLQSIDNTNTDEEDWDVLCYSLPPRLENSRSK